MSDRSFVSAVVYAAPEHLHEQVTALLVEHLGIDEQPLVLGLSYEEEQVSLGNGQRLAYALRDLSADLAFSIHQSAHYEYDGDWQAQVPGLGFLDVVESAAGEVVVDQAELLAVATSAATGWEMVRAVARLYGTPWARALSEYAAAQDAALNPGHPHAVMCWDFLDRGAACEHGHLRQHVVTDEAGHLVYRPVAA